MKVAITGHQNLGTSEQVSWLRSTIDQQLLRFQFDLGYSCLAAGADQLFAHLMIKRKIPLITIIPCQNYEATFDDENLQNYRYLLRASLSHIQLQYQQPSETAFFEASKLMVNYCDVLFAVWDDKPAQGLGGTADVVQYGRELKKIITHFNPFTKKIIRYGTS